MPTSVLVTKIKINTFVISILLAALFDLVDVTTPDVPTRAYHVGHVLGNHLNILSLNLLVNNLNCIVSCFFSRNSFTLLVTFQ